MSGTPIVLTQQQEQAFHLIKGFLNNPNQQIFILKGYAGTGKTTLLQEIAAHLFSKKIAFALLAPTGRAAAVLAAKTGFAAKTLHSELYHFKDVEGEADPDKKETVVDDYGQMRLLFEIRANDLNEAEKVYIVDEASMIGNEANDQNSFASFGSGFLLNDFLNLAGKNKIIFSGDPCQLPPVGSPHSLALDENYFRKIGKSAVAYEITEILRQKQDSDVLNLATKIRQLTAASYYPTKWVKIPARSSKYIRVAPYAELKDLYIREIIDHGTNQSIAISLSNINCHQINMEVREKKYRMRFAPLQKGDLLMVTQNNYLVPLTNGDFVEVVEIGNRVTEAGLSFVRVTVKARLTGFSHEVLLCTEPLMNGQSNLTPDQQRLLMISFSQKMRVKGIKPKTEGYYFNMKKDPFLNSLRANYGYAVTCHKSQGGEWDKVFFFLNKGMYTMDPAELTRWWYTGVTRSKEELYLASEWWIGDNYFL